MSGTSLDGLDIAYCEFLLEDKIIRYKILYAETLPYPAEMSQRLETGIHMSGLELSLLNNDLGTWMGNQCLNFINKNRIKPDFISSHGHTIYHQPEKELTMQIGGGNIIHAITKIPVVFDFRTLDIALGGQGAPLVPIGDELLFPQYQICLNLGGFANISFNDGKNRKAYDIGAINIVLNKLAQKIGYEYDSEGQIAQSGSTIQELSEELDRILYYSQPWPKSLGKEWVDNKIMPLIDHYQDHKIEDILHTYSNHIANRIATDINHLKNAIFEGVPIRILITGGGAYNKYVITSIRNLLVPGIEIIIPEDIIVAYKESLIFALMGLLRIKGLPNCLQSVTGAKYNHCSGIVVGPIKSIKQEQV